MVQVQDGPRTGWSRYRDPPLASINELMGLEECPESLRRLLAVAHVRHPRCPSTVVHVVHKYKEKTHSWTFGPPLY